MTPQAIARLNDKIQTEIPLAHAAGIRLECSDDNTIVARAPLTANGNPHGSAFGGSLYVTALVAGYARTVLLVEQAGVDASVVVSHAQAEYHQPLHADISASVVPIDEKVQNRFIKSLTRHGRGRIDLTVRVIDAKIRVFELHLRFAAIGP